jgi:hypothetical protein
LARVTSPNPVNLEVESGRRYLGFLATPAQDGLVVVQGTRTDTLKLGSVIEITPISASFVERVTAYLDIGFTLAKANQATTFSLSGKTDYQGPTIGAEISFDSYAQGQESVATTTRNTIRQSVSWYLGQKWSAIGLAQQEQNDELDLDHRITAGGAMERQLGHTNQYELSTGAGIVGTQEKFTSTTGTSSGTNLEGLLSLSWDAFRFDSPKLDFGVRLAAFPSLSESGRVRGQADIRLEYELFKDFNTGIRFSDTFDSRPPQETATKNDYVTTLTIGWSYRR